MEMTTNLLNTGIDNDVSIAREISLDELENVNGGILPAILAVAAVSFAVGYFAGASSCAC